MNTEDEQSIIYSDMEAAIEVSRTQLACIALEAYLYGKSVMRLSKITIDHIAL